MKTYKIGIIGYGGFGRFLRHWWDKLENVQVVAVSDTNPVDNIKEGIMHYGAWEDLLDDPAIDIVSIATPPDLHVEIACAAMRKSKHVILEKPIALTREGAREIIRVQKETGMVITVDHMLRYNPIVKALIALSRDELFGKLRHAEVSNYAQDEGLPSQHWFWDKEISGGIFVEHGVHFFDIVNALTNQSVTKVYGCSHYRNKRLEDQVAATVLYDEGLMASHYHSFSGPGFFEQTTIRLAYDLARIEIEGWMPMKGKIKALCTIATRDKLNTIPGLQIEKTVPVSEINDVSRPEGWGVSETVHAGNIVRSAGLDYNVQDMIEASFELTHTKSEIYGTCLQDILCDIITKIEDKSHELQITLDDAFKALKTAVAADSHANGRYTENYF